MTGTTAVKMGTVHRDHLNLVSIEKRLKGGRIGARDHSNSPRKTAISTGGSIYPVECKRKGGLRLCFGMLGACGCGRTELPADSTKENWTFFRGFFALVR